MFNNKKYQLGDYLIVPERCVIDRDGIENKLELRVMQVLVCLLERAGRPVSRDELIQEVWRGGIVSDNAINRIIGILRTSLGDDARTQAVIKTLPKVGYLLVSDTLQPLTMKLLSESELASNETMILGSDASSLMPDGSSASSEPGNRVRNRPNKYVIGAALLLSLLTCWYWFIPFVSSLQNSNHVADNILTLVPLTSLDGQEVDPILSPDGKKLAFSFRERDGSFWRIMTQDVASGTINFVESIPEPGMNQRYPAWSNDGGHLAFLNFDGQSRCEMVLLDMLTRTRKVLTTCHPSLQSGALAFRGKELIFIDTEGLDNYKKIYRINIETLRREQLSQPHNIGRGDYGLTLSPDGEKLAVLRNFGWFDTLVMLFDFSTGEWQQLFKVGYPLKSLAWHKENHGLIYRAEEGQLHLFDINTKKVARLTHASQEINSPRSSDKGEVVAVSGDLIKEELWLWSSPFINGTKPAPWVTSDRRDFRGAISSDGTFTAFISNRTGLPQIWLKKQEGQELQLTKFSSFSHIDELTFSPSSKFLAGSINGAAFRLNVASNEVEFVPNRNSVKNISFGMTDEDLVILTLDNGKRQLLLIDADTGNTKKLLSADGFSGKYDRETGLFYYSKMHQQGIWTLRDGAEVLVTDKFTPFFSCSWQIIDNSIWYLDRIDEQFYLAMISISSGEERRQKIEVKNLSTRILSMTNDHRILLSVLDDANTDIVFLM
ncbi:winged helix-turn-helix domain-containing protein [Shewanella cyperi]|uniref:winged helix-turn-helix domain-containing protein n=1 Tax=Shewanella cyperi TaxID=2814292 RepID=UPI001A94946F|nr:winged helix-turn-helix domain-containing protein [Shewanella cyperi]QSX41337.1 winged helix-turn-helix domain-containing protein [Shewanella cyperi]